jgi:calcium-dependent protein kinase
MYTMLCGHPPFLGESDAEVLAGVRSGYFSFDDPEWKSVGGDAKNLIMKLLQKSPRDRYTAMQALAHRWIEKKHRADKLSTDSALVSKIVTNLRSYATLSRVQQLTLSIIAQQCSSSEIRQFQDAFLAFDKSGRGRLSSADLQNGLQTIGLRTPPADLRQIMEDLANHGDGCIGHTDFMAAMLDRRLCFKDELCKWPFHALSPQTWKKSDAVRRHKSSPCVTDGDADFQEFMQAVRRPPGRPTFPRKASKQASISCASKVDA